MTKPTHKLSTMGTSRDGNAVPKANSMYTLFDKPENREDLAQGIYGRLRDSMVSSDVRDYVFKAMVTRAFSDMGWESTGIVEIDTVLEREHAAPAAKA